MKSLMLVLALAGAVAATAADVAGQKREAGGAGGQSAAAPVSRAVGIVKGLDAGMGRIIIAHEAIPALKWPAMIMSFRISPELAKGLKADQKVEFEFLPKDMDGTITRVTVLPR